jgi:hypothetical protein
MITNKELIEDYDYSYPTVKMFRHKHFKDFYTSKNVYKINATSVPEPNQRFNFIPFHKPYSFSEQTYQTPKINKPLPKQQKNFEIFFKNENQRLNTIYKSVKNDYTIMFPNE